MKSDSLFSPALFRRTLARCWPLWAATVLLLLYLLPFGMADTPRDAMRTVTLHRAALLGLPLGVLGLVFAAATFGFLFRPRDAHLAATLPLRRGAVFGTVLAAGAAMLLTAGMLAAIFAAALTLRAGTQDLTAVMLWLVMYIMEALAFYGVGVFCAMLSGRLGTMVWLYLLVCFGGFALTRLLNDFADRLLIGLPAEDAMMILILISALLLPSSLLAVSYVAFREGAAHLDVISGFGGLRYVAIWLGISAVLTLLALRLFKRRRLETTQDAFAVPAVGTVLKYITVFYAALAVPVLASLPSENLMRSTPLVLLCAALGAAAGWLASELLLRRSLRPGKRGWLVLGAALGVTLLVVGVLRLGMPDPGTVPAPETVSSAEVTAWDTATATLTAPDDIETLTGLHRTLLSALYRGSTGDVRIVYHLTDGSTQETTLRMPLQTAPDAAETQLRALFRRESAAVLDTQYDPLHTLTEDVIVRATLQYQPGAFNADGVFEYENDVVSVALSPAEAAALYAEALRPDRDAGAYPSAYDVPAWTQLPCRARVEIVADWPEEGEQTLCFFLNTGSAATNDWLPAHGFDLPGME